MNKTNVEWMYRDNPNISVATIPLGQRSEKGEYDLVNDLVQSTGGKLIRIGHKPPYHHDDPVSPDEKFYIECGLSYELRFDNFYVCRDIASEMKTFDAMNPSEEPYVFVQSDPQWPLRKEWPDDIKVIYNDPGVPLFDLGLILEHAEELHLPNSSIRCLAECRSVYDMSKPKLFFHDMRAPIWGNSSRLDWTLVHYSD